MLMLQKIFLRNYADNCHWQKSTVLLALFAAPNGVPFGVGSASNNLVFLVEELLNLFENNEEKRNKQ